MLKKTKVIGTALTLLASLFIATAQADMPEAPGNMIQLEPGKRPVVITPARSSELVPSTIGKSTLYTGKANTSAISYTYGNPVMNSPRVKLVWYGSWVNPAAPANSPATNDYKNFVNQFVTDFASNPRWNINKKYYSFINNVTAYIGSLNFDPSADNIFLPTNSQKYGSTLSQSSIQQIAVDASTANGKILDLNAIYLVLTSSDILVTGFNTGTIQFCGWHSAVSTSNSMKYGFVGDSANATWCQGQTGGQSPNGNVGADSMISVLAHEIEEAATDPYIYGTVWRDTMGYENSDKCAWTWGSTSFDQTKQYYYNLTINGHNYLIQQGFALATKKSSRGKDTWSGSCVKG